jgi:uncharacterized membrane protein
MKCRWLIVPLFAFAAVSSQAVPPFLEELKKNYGVKPGSTLDKAGCAICHAGPPKKNEYGKLVDSTMAESDSLTARILERTEADDSDGDGVSNGEELKGDSLPGDVKSKPAEGTSEKSLPLAGPPAVSTSNPEESKGDLIPKHSFHPALSHFPLALFAIAAVFAVLAKQKQSDTYQKASLLNLGAGLLLSIVTIITGVVAMLRLGYAIEGTMLFHLLLASVSTLLGLAAYSQRDKKAYVPLLIVCAVLVLAAGHFGGDMVYGS